MKHAPSKAIYLIRHGETSWSRSGRHTGKTDIPLTDEGIAQSKMVASRIQNLSFSAVFTSPLQRVFATCQICKLDRNAIISPDLVEWDYGEYEGLTTQEIRKKDPSWDLFVKGVPQGESIPAITQRADRFLHQINSLTGNIAIFSSGHFSRVLTMRWLGLSAEMGRCFALATASISILGYERNEHALLLWNDVSHYQKLC